MASSRFFDSPNGVSLAMCLAVALALPLAGCGGGDGGGLSPSTPSMAMSLVGNGGAPGDGRVPAPVAEQTVASVAPVPQVLPELSPAPSQDSRDVYTEFDGEDIRVHIGVTDYGAVHIPDYGVSSEWLSSVLHASQSSSVRSRLAGHSEHTWTLWRPDSALFYEDLTVVANARWRNDNADDYLAGGWWVSGVAGGLGHDATAFIDGPELRGELPESMSLPLKGQATYRGEAAGHYDADPRVVCVAYPCPGPPTGTGPGEFSADATLWADFVQGTIEGCVGCQAGIKMTPTSFDKESGSIERHESFSLNYLLWLHTGSFLDSPGTLGTFNSDLTAIAHTGLQNDVNGTTCGAAGDVACAEEETARVVPPDDDDEAPAVGSGSWRGRFSDIDDKEGNPRLVGATLEGRLNHVFGDTFGDTDFTGYLIAESTAHADRGVFEDDRIVRESKEILYAPDTQPVDPPSSRGKQAPIIDLDSTRYVGANVVPPAEIADLFTVGESFGEIETSFGRATDGTSVDRMIEFLEPHMNGGTSNAGEFTYTLGYTGLPTFVDRPVVRLAAGTSEEFTSYAVRAVELLNSALPYEQRIEFSSDPAPALSPIDDIPDGEIFIDFAATSDDWNLVNRDFRPGSAAINQPDLAWEWDAEQQRWEAKSMRASHVWIDVERIRNAAWVFNSDSGQFEERLLDKPVTDPEIRVYSEEDVFSIMVHELMHALGFGAHNDQDRFADSILRGDNLLITARLPRIDSDGLLAAYTRLEPGAEPEELSPQSLGPWSGQPHIKLPCHQ